MSRDTRQNVLNLIDHLFPDNATGEITPQDAREIVKKIINTAVCYEDSSFPNDRDQKPSFPVRYSDDNGVVTFTHATKVTGSGVKSHNGDMLHFHVPDEVDGMAFTVKDDGTGDLVLKAGSKNIASVNIPLGQSAPVDSNQIIDTIGAWLSSDIVTGLNASFNSTTNTLTITSKSNSPQHVVYVDHGFSGASDGSRHAPHKSLNDAVSDLITNGHSAIEVEGIGDVQGVVDFSGLNYDISIIADFSPVVGTWIFPANFNHFVHVRCASFSVSYNKEGVVKFIELSNSDRLSTNQNAKFDSVIESTRGINATHYQTKSFDYCKNVVSYSSGFSGGRFNFPTNQMIFHSSNKNAIYHLLGISSDAEWDAIVDVIKLPILPENHEFQVNGKECYVSAHSIHGSGQYQFKMYRPDGDITKADIDVFLNQGYNTASGETHNANSHTQGDLRVDGHLINPLLEYNIHSLGEIGTEVAVACDSLHSVASGETYIPQFVDPEIDEDGNLVGGVFIAPYTGGYHFDVAVTSNHVTLGGKPYHLKLKREKPDGTTEQLSNPKDTKEVYSYTQQTSAGQNIYFNVSGPIILYIDDKLIIEFSHEAEQDLSIGLLLQVDSHNASNLTLKKLDRRLKYLEDRLEIDEYKILVVNENGDISTKDKPVS